MNKKLLILISFAFLLTSCTRTPDSVKSNNHKTENVIEYKTVNTKDAWSDTDEAYKTEYKKFRLPDRSTFSHRDFDELYNAKITYVNNEDNSDWSKEHIKKFEDVFNIKISGEPEFVKNNALNHFDDNYEVILGTFNSCSLVYKGPFESEPFSIRYILNQNQKPDNKKIEKYIKESADLSEKSNKALEYETQNIPAFVMLYGDKTAEIYSQTYYKDVGIECVIPHYTDKLYDENPDGIQNLASYMQNFTRYYDDKLYGYYGSLGFKTVDAQKIDKIISFKSACDILEKELSANIDLKFDEVELWYQPTGKVMDTSKDNYGINDKNITLTPKWYFLINNQEDKMFYAAQYVTVDCVTGEIHVMIGGEN